MYVIQRKLQKDSTYHWRMCILLFIRWKTIFLNSIYQELLHEKHSFRRILTAAGWLWQVFFHFIYLFEFCFQKIVTRKSHNFFFLINYSTTFSLFHSSNYHFMVGNDWFVHKPVFLRRWRFFVNSKTRVYYPFVV